MKTISAHYLVCACWYCILFVSCNGTDSNAPSTYQPIFAKDTGSDKTLIMGFPNFSFGEIAEPLVKYLNAHLHGVHVKIKACTTYDEYLSLLKGKKFDITLINGIQAYTVKDSGYSIVGKVSNDMEYTAVIFARKDAHIVNVSDLKGKAVALVASPVIPGTMMSLYYLHEHGLKVNQDIQHVNVSSFESTIISTYLGKSEAGGCLSWNWNNYTRSHPDILTRVELKWITPPLIHNALVFKSSLDTAIVSRLTSLFFSMHTTDEGKAVIRSLDVKGFEKADERTYKPMMEFKQKYDSIIL